jgi:hypothetical protein
MHLIGYICLLRSFKVGANTTSRISAAEHPSPYISTDNREKIEKNPLFLIFLFTLASNFGMM